MRDGVITNRFAGRCCSMGCRKQVPAGAGVVRYRRIWCVKCSDLHDHMIDDMRPIDEEGPDDRPIYGFGE